MLILLSNGRRKGGSVGSGSACADGQEHFPAQRVLEFLEVERRFAFVAQDLEDRWPAFVGYFHAAILQVHDMHLERLDLKIPVVAAVRASQRHVDSFRDSHAPARSADCHLRLIAPQVPAASRSNRLRLGRRATRTGPNI